jgi:hypothetical protein
LTLLRSDYTEILNFQIGFGNGETIPTSTRVMEAILDTPPDAIPAADDGPYQTASARSRMIERMMSEETALIPLIFSQKDLLGRGWSRRLIKEVLGEPHATARTRTGAASRR